MLLIHVNNKLPKNNTYVLARYIGGNWGDRDHQDGVVWVVVKFIRGLSKKDRECLPSSDKRKTEYYHSDENKNNKKPYIWDAFGPGMLFGQEVDYWTDLPILNKQEIQKEEED